MMWVPMKPQSKTYGWRSSQEGLIGQVVKNTRGEIVSSVVSEDGNVLWRTKSQPHYIDAFKTVAFMIGKLSKGMK